MNDNIKVAIRIRPLIDREIKCQNLIHWKKINDDSIVQIDPINGKQILSNTFTYDYVFDSAANNWSVYSEIAQPIVKSAMQGFNGTIFAYGQTSSGKTYTIMGALSFWQFDAQSDSDSFGILPCTILEIFEEIENSPDREFMLRISYMEIYNEQITDLLTGETKLNIRESQDGEVFVENLKEEIVSDVLAIADLLAEGERRRHFGDTKMNDHSSRSHTIFKIIIESREREDSDSSSLRLSDSGVIVVSRLNIVDLAGSERASQTGTEGQRLKEGCSINKSLFMLSQVISKLSTGSEGQYVGFRDSKLTRILQNSLGGNAKTVVICAITPAAIDETASTLRFASSAKQIKNKPIKNEILTDEALLRRYQREINELRMQVINLKSQQNLDLIQLQQEDLMRQLKDKEDKISQLTQLFCASSRLNTVPEEKKMNKSRRETWAPGLLSCNNNKLGVLMTSPKFPAIRRRVLEVLSPDVDSDDILEKRCKSLEAQLPACVETKLVEKCISIDLVKNLLPIEGTSAQQGFNRSMQTDNHDESTGPLAAKLTDLEKLSHEKSDEVNHLLDQLAVKDQDVAELLKMCEEAMQEKDVKDSVHQALSIRLIAIQEELCRLKDENNILRNMEYSRMDLEEFHRVELDAVRNQASDFGELQEKLIMTQTEMEKLRRNVIELEGQLSVSNKRLTNVEKDKNDFEWMLDHERSKHSKEIMQWKTRYEEAQHDLDCIRDELQQKQDSLIEQMQQAQREEIRRIQVEYEQQLCMMQQAKCEELKMMRNEMETHMQSEFGDLNAQRVAEIENFKAIISQLNNSLSKKDQIITEKQQHLNLLEKTLITSKAELEKQQKQNEKWIEMQREAASLREQLQLLSEKSCSRKELETRLSQLQSEVNDLFVERNQTNNLIDDMRLEINGKSEKIQELMDEILDYQDRDDKYKEMATVVGSLTREKSKLLTSIESLTTKLNKYKEMEKTSPMHQVDLDLKLKEIVDYQDKILSCETEITDLQSKLTAANIQNGKLTDRIDELLKQFQEIDESDKEVFRLEREILVRNHAMQIEELEKQLAQEVQCKRYFQAEIERQQKNYNHKISILKSKLSVNEPLVSKENAYPNLLLEQHQQRKQDDDVNSSSASLSKVVKDATVAVDDRGKMALTHQNHNVPKKHSVTSNSNELAETPPQCKQQ